MMGVILPLLSKYKYDRIKFESIQNKIYKLLALLSVIIVYSISSFVTPVIDFLFEGRYNSSIPVIRILIWALIPTFLDMISGYILIASDNEKEPLKINLIAIMISLAANFFILTFFFNKFLGYSGIRDKYFT